MTRTSTLAADFERSGLTRGEYCRRHGIPVSTLDYYRRQAKRMDRPVRILPVEIEAAEGRARSLGFALVLSRGRRIECDWSFREADLARLIQVAEQA